MRWTWDTAKETANRWKHNISFEVAVSVFDDPFAETTEDTHSIEARWRTVGMVASQILVVIHTYPDEGLAGSEQLGRIISARKAMPDERRRYEEGNA